MNNLSLGKEKIKFLMLEGLHDNAFKVLSEAGYTNVENIKTALDKEELIEKIKDVHFIGIRSRTNLTRDVLERAEKISRYRLFLYWYQPSRFGCGA